MILHSLLKGEGLVVNKKRTYRVYTQESLQVRTKKRKKLQRPRLPMEVPLKVTDPLRSAGGWIDRLGAPIRLPDWLTENDLNYIVSQFEKAGFVAA